MKKVIKLSLGILFVFILLSLVIFVDVKAYDGQFSTDKMNGYSRATTPSNNGGGNGGQDGGNGGEGGGNGGVGCGESPYCCDGSPSSIQCDSIPVVTPCPDGCCGIKLNTNFPIIGNCIKSANATGAFPMMMGALTKIIMSLILVVCFILIIAAGVLWASAGEDSNKAKTARGIIEKVAITILLLGFSGVILRLINPNFFG